MGIKGVCWHTILLAALSTLTDLSSDLQNRTTCLPNISIGFIKTALSLCCLITNSQWKQTQASWPSNVSCFGGRTCILNLKHYPWDSLLIHLHSWFCRLLSLCPTASKTFQFPLTSLATNPLMWHLLRHGPSSSSLKPSHIDVLRFLFPLHCYCVKSSSCHSPA